MGNEGELLTVQGDGATPWVRYLLVVLLLEKVVQHIFVTLAFIFNWGDIRSEVAAGPDVLMVLGAMVAVLYALGLWAFLTRRSWSVHLMVALALFDIVGEFVAQGRIDIVITVSFLVATVLLILTLRYRRRMLVGTR